MMSIPVHPPAAASPLSLEDRALVEAWLKEQITCESSPCSVIPARAGTSPARASHGQEQIWLHSSIAGNALIYNEAVTVHYRGSLNRDALRKSMGAFIQRHEAWRTTFVLEDGVLLQKIHPHMAVTIPFSDLSVLPEKKRESRALEIARKDALLPFDLSTGPLLRCRLVQLNDRIHRLYICLHHIIFDGVSLYNIFLPELAALYRAFSESEEPQLPPLAIRYGDYAEWHRQAVTAGIAEELTYWKATLSGMKELSLPADRPRPAQQSFRGSMEVFMVPKDTAEALREVGCRVNASLFMVLTAVLAVHARLWSGADDIPIGSASSGRKWTETENVVGFFLNTLVFRIDTSDDPAFIQLVERTKGVVLSAMEHDEVPFSSIVKELRTERDPSRHPLFQIMFSLEPPLPALEPGWGFTQMDVETGVMKFDLHLEMDERAEGILARFIYSTDLFNPKTIQNMAKEWLRIARHAAAQPDAPISQLVPRPSHKLRERVLDFFKPRPHSEGPGACEEIIGRAL